MHSDLHNLAGEMAAADAVCDMHGPYVQKVTTLLGKEFRTDCPECTRARRELDEAKERQEAARIARYRLEQKLESALIPKRFAGRDFDGYSAETPRQQKALNTCREYADNFATHARAGRCLLLLGKPGTGKTHLAAAIANQVMRNTSSTAIYRTLGGLLMDIRATYDRAGSGHEAKVICAVTESDLLVLDEIGATKATEFELATLFAVINGRYEEMRPTIIVSNLMPAELAPAIGERCVDRLREGGGIALVFDWESARAEIGRGEA